MDELLAYAPDGMNDALMGLCVPLVAAGFGLIVLFWFLGALWSVVLSMFEL